MEIRVLSKILLIFFFGSLLVACDQDPFGLSNRKIAGTYSLHRWEDFKTYYIDTEESRGQSGGGAIDGIVLKIGWNADYILVKRQPLYGGDAIGWILINVKKSRMTGPFSNQEIAKMNEVKGMRIVDPGEAWEKLC